MSLGKLKKRHEAAVKSSPFAKKLAARKSSTINQKTRLEYRRTTAKIMNGFRLGDSVKCVWKYDPSYGRGNGTFTGTLIEIRPDKNDAEFFFTLRDKHGVILDHYTPMCKLTKVK